MPRKPKNAQRNPKGCKICGDPDVGRGIKTHVEGAHGVPYDAYITCFGGTVLVDKPIITGTSGKGSKKVVIHVLVRRFIVDTQDTDSR